jgi:hypothetical protein
VVRLSAVGVETVEAYRSALEDVDGAGAVKDGAALGRDRRIPKAFSFRDHARPLPPSLLREPFVECPRSSSFD